MKSAALLCLLSLGSSLLAAAPHKVLDGSDTADWRYFSKDSTTLSDVCSFTPEGVASIKGKPIGYLVTKKSYHNYRMHLEWRWLAPKGNSGVLIHQSATDKVWPLCLQFQMKVGAVGELIPMEGFSFAETLAPNAKSLPKLEKDSEKPVGEWNEADILVRDGLVECTVNGVLQGRATACKPAEGLVGIQLEGTPFELRHVTIEEL